MEIVAKSHIPVEQYGFIEIEYSFVGGDRDDFHKEIIEDYNLIKERFKTFNQPSKPSDPIELGQTMLQNNHTYKAVMNEATKKLYWLIDKV